MPVQTLTETATSLTLGVGGVVGTNIENVVVAVAIFCVRVPATALATGFFAALMVLLAISWLGAMVIGLLPARYLGLLGVIPIIIGLQELFQDRGILLGNRGVDYGSGFVRYTGAVLLMMVVNGVDTIAVFAPLIAESELTDRIVITAGYVLSSGVLAWVCVYACTHPLFATPIERYGNRIAPFIMIGIGVYILMNTSTDLLTGGGLY